MKIDKAIEILKIENKSPWNHTNSDLRHAVKLGIEALTAIRYWRNDWSADRFHTLPGEDEYTAFTPHATPISEPKP